MKQSAKLYRRLIAYALRYRPILLLAVMGTLIHGLTDIALAANPIKFSATPTRLYQSPPTLGAHNEEVLAEFGIEPPAGGS